MLYLQLTRYDVCNNSYGTFSIAVGAHPEKQKEIEVVSQWLIVSGEQEFKKQKVKHAS